MVRCRFRIRIQLISLGFPQTLQPLTTLQSVILQPTISVLLLLYITLLLTKVTIRLVSPAVPVFLICTKDTPKVRR